MSIYERANRQKKQIKTEILEAAKEIAKEVGWSTLSTRKLAQRVEYSTMIIYTHFSNKDEVLLELREQGFAEYLDITKRIKEEVNDPIKAIRDISLEVFSLSNQEPEIHQLMFNYSGFSCENLISIKGKEAFLQVGTLFSQAFGDEYYSRHMGWWASHQGFVALMLSKVQSYDDLLKLYTEHLDRMLK